MQFFSKNQSYLGVDIGRGSIKVAELQNDNARARLLTYGFAEQKVKEILTKDFTDTPEYTGKLIQKICDKAGVRTKKVVAALPIFSVFSSILTLTNVTKKELANTKLLANRVEWEAKKIVPMPLEEMILDWKLLREKPSEPPFVATPEPARTGEEKKETEANESVVIPESLQGAQVLLTAAPKKLVEKYIEIFKYAKLELLSLETEAFALIRSLVGNDRSPVMVLDSGAGRTSISIIDNGIPYLNRSVDLGGAAITEALAKRLQMDVEKAEQFKLDLANAGPNTAALDALTSILNPMVNEIQYSLNLYRGQAGAQAKTIDKIILTGGTALLTNLTEYLKKTLNMRVFVGDPWARVMYPEDLKPLLDEVGPRFSVAVGLAMRDIE